MIASVLQNLQTWWQNIQAVHGAEVREHLGFLVFLMDIQTNEALVQLLVEFWDPSTPIF